MLLVGAPCLERFALYLNNLAGSLWLVWYGIMYLCATLLIYRYG